MFKVIVLNNKDIDLIHSKNNSEDLIKYVNTEQNANVVRIIGTHVHYLPALDINYQIRQYTFLECQLHVSSLITKVIENTVGFHISDLKIHYNSS